MSVTNQTPYKQFVAAPGATLFSSDFRVILGTDLVVRKDGVDQSTGFTISGLGNPSGVDVTFGVPMVGGEFIELLRQVPLTRLTDYQQSGDFLAPVVNVDFDRLWMALQDSQFLSNLAILLPVGDPLAPMSIPDVAARASRFLAFDALGQAIAAAGSSGVPVSPYMATLLDDLDAAAARATLQAAGAGANNDITSLGALTTPMAGFLNLVINGNFAVNQRAYASGAATVGANQYTLDQWRVVVSGQSITYVTSGNGRIVTAPAGGMEQPIDGASIAFANNVINWVGTATCTVDGVAKTKGAPVTLVPGTNAVLRFTGGTVSEVQLQPGTVPTVFERRPFRTELELCAWYYRLWEVGYSDAVASTGTRYAFTAFPEMRAAPSVTNLAAIGTQSNVSTVAFSDITARGLRMDITPSASATVLCRRALALSSLLP